MGVVGAAIGRGHRTRYPAIWIVAGVSVLAAAGAIGSIVSVSSSSPPQVIYRTGESVKTSFGIVAVEFANVLPGVSSDELAGQTHNVHNLVDDAKANVTVSATLTNLSDRPVSYSATQFRVVLGNGKPVPVSTTSIRNGVLQPSSNVDEQLSFVVPRANEAVYVEFRDPDGRSIKIRVGHTDQAPLDAGTHQH